MHRKPEAEVLPLDTELERTLRNMKKVIILEASIMAEQRQTSQKILDVAAERPQQRQRIMEDF